MKYLIIVDNKLHSGNYPTKGAARKVARRIARGKVLHTVEIEQASAIEDDVINNRIFRETVR